MREPQIDIYNTLKKNSLITKLVIIISGIVCIVSIVSVVNIYKTSNRYVYGISKEKELLPLVLIEKKELEEVFIKAHIELFITKFYQYDQWNYEKQIEKALWLIDDTGKELYFFYKNSGHYNLLIQSTSSQSVEIEEVNIDNTGNFIVKVIIDINKPNQIEKNRYALICKGKLVKVSQNYPKNPYGYLIQDFKEVSNTKIKK